MKARSTTCATRALTRRRGPSGSEGARRPGDVLVYLPLNSSMNRSRSAGCPRRAAGAAAREGEDVQPVVQSSRNVPPSWPQSDPCWWRPPPGRPPWLGLAAQPPKDPPPDPQELAWVPGAISAPRPQKRAAVASSKRPRAVAGVREGARSWPKISLSRVSGMAAQLTARRAAGPARISAACGPPAPWVRSHVDQAQSGRGRGLLIMRWTPASARSATAAIPRLLDAPSQDSDLVRVRARSRLLASRRSRRDPPAWSGSRTRPGACAHRGVHRGPTGEDDDRTRASRGARSGERAVHSGIMSR